MNLDTKACYRALKSRDARFDGRFFTAVLSTGIYCRPVCPAPTPKAENCRFYPCAAAAEDAGFRPCLRCRPETSPGTPAWMGTSATVARALKLIHEGGLDGGSVEGLAGRLGIGGRHLRRLFFDYFGASPLAVAQSRRVHFAKTLIDETRLPMSEVAFSAGFKSVRRFNDAVRATYGRPPRDLRLSSRHLPPEGNGAHLTLRLSFRPPMAWGEMMEFLSARATPGVEAVESGCYRRTVEIDGARGIIDVWPSDRGHDLHLRIPSELSRGLKRIADGARNLFDLDADPARIDEVLGRDKTLAPLVASCPGLRVPGAFDPFEVAVRAILGQQVTVRAATTLAGRLAERFGDPFESGEKGLGRIFPRPEVLSRARLAGIGLPAARAAAIRRLAAAVAAGDVILDGAGGADRAAEELTGIPGIGEWTASYVGMRAFREPDAFPAGDLGLRHALGARSDLPGRREILARAEAWRPWRAYAAMHLWRRGTRRSR